jgi:uncharacterized membrane protein required for colicin V production
MDAIVVIILMVAVCYGAKRGLLESLAGLLIVFMAVAGAGIAAGTFAGPVTEAVTPLIEERVAEKVREAVEEQAGSVEWDLFETDDADTGLMDEALNLLGLDEEVRKSLAERAESTVKDTGTTLAVALVKSLVHTVIHGILFVLAFALLLLLLKVLTGAMGLVLQLPGLRLLNTLGGAFFGLVEGALLLFLAVWVSRRLGVSFETPPLSEAHILEVFTTNTPLGLLSFLQ